MMTAVKQGTVLGIQQTVSVTTTATLEETAVQMSAESVPNVNIFTHSFLWFICCFFIAHSFLRFLSHTVS